MHLQEAIADFKEAADEVYAKFGCASGDIVVASILADVFMFAAAKLRLESATVQTRDEESAI